MHLVYVCCAYRDAAHTGVVLWRFKCIIAEKIKSVCNLITSLTFYNSVPDKENVNILLADHGRITMDCVVLFARITRFQLLQSKIYIIIVKA